MQVYWVSKTISLPACLFAPTIITMIKGQRKQTYCCNRILRPVSRSPSQNTTQMLLRSASTMLSLLPRNAFCIPPFFPTVFIWYWQTGALRQFAFFAKQVPFRSILGINGGQKTIAFMFMPPDATCTSYHRYLYDVYVYGVYICLYDVYMMSMSPTDALNLRSLMSPKKRSILLLPMWASVLQFPQCTATDTRQATER